MVWRLEASLVDIAVKEAILTAAQRTVLVLILGAQEEIEWNDKSPEVAR